MRTRTRAAVLFKVQKQCGGARRGAPNASVEQLSAMAGTRAESESAGGHAVQCVAGGKKAESCGRGEPKKEGTQRIKKVQRARRGRDERGVGEQGGVQAMRTVHVRRRATATMDDGLNVCATYEASTRWPHEQSRAARRGAIPAFSAAR